MIADLLLPTRRLDGLDHSHVRSVRCYWTNVTFYWTVHPVRDDIARSCPHPWARWDRHQSRIFPPGDTRILGAHRRLLDHRLIWCPRAQPSVRPAIVGPCLHGMCERT